MFNFTKDQILESVNNSLNLLGVNYIDLLQVSSVVTATMMVYKIEKNINVPTGSRR